MTLEEIRTITDERLRQYRARMQQHHATPFFCLGVGHDHNEGKVVTCLVDGVPLDVVLGFLKQTVALIEKELKK